MTSATAISRLGSRSELGVLQRLTGDYLAAAASTQQALKQYRDLGDRSGQAHALNQLGLVQQLTGDYPAAAASHQQALRLYRDLGQRHEQAEALNSLGEYPPGVQPASRPVTTTTRRLLSPAGRRASGGSTRPGRNRPQLPP